MKVTWIVYALCFVICESLLCPTAIAQLIPAEIREGFILLEQDTHERIQAELALMDSLREANKAIKQRLLQLQKELDSKALEINKIEVELYRNQAEIDQQIYNLRAEIRLMNMRFRDHKVQYEKYAKRRLTHNEKRALQLLGIMTGIITGLILLDTR